MKTILLTTLAWALSTSACFGQVEAVEAARREAAEQLDEYRMRMQLQQAEYKKAVETGRSLFGVDRRWTEERDKIAGTLLGKPPTDFRIGDWGSTSAQFRAIGKVSDTEFLAMPQYKDAQVMLIRGLDTSKVTDGAEFVLQHPVAIQGTYSYTAVSGSQKTVLVLERNDHKLSDILAKNEAALFRTWRDDTGKHAFDAKFLEFKNGRVHLEHYDQKPTEVPMSRLSKEDQKWVRDELKNRSEKEKSQTKTKRKGKSR